MLKQIIAAALLSTSLVAGAAAPAFAGGDEGTESTFWADRAAKQKAAKVNAPAKQAAKKVKKAKKHAKKGDFIRSRNPDGSSITVTANGDGTRTIVERNARGQVTSRRTVGRTPDFAHNHTTGVTAVGIGGGVRVVIGPFGFSFSN